MKGKSACKLALQQHLGLEEGASKILVGCIYSGISDVDFDKLKVLFWMASNKGVQFVFMGSSQTPAMKRTFEIFQDEDKKVRFIDEYNEELSHLIISGSDIMLCPSFDDHLLQVPLKAMKYGAAPIPVNVANKGFRHFGDDTTERSRLSRYINSTFGNISLGQRTISELAIDFLFLRVDTCVAAYLLFVHLQKSNPSEWSRRIIDGMGKDFSWDSECAEVHISAYEAVKEL